MIETSMVTVRKGDHELSSFLSNLGVEREQSNYTQPKTWSGSTETKLMGFKGRQSQTVKMWTHLIKGNAVLF